MIVLAEEADSPDGPSGPAGCRDFSCETRVIEERTVEPRVGRPRSARVGSVWCLLIGATVACGPAPRGAYLAGDGPISLRIAKAPTKFFM